MLEFSAPPSTNSLYANIPGKGRVRTKAYKAWIDAAGWEIKAQARGYRVPGKFALSVWLPPGLDLDNIKSVADLLSPPTKTKKHGLGITDDDKHMDELHVYRWPGPKCRIELKGIPQPPPPAPDEPPLPLGLT